MTQASWLVVATNWARASGSGIKVGITVAGLITAVTRSSVRPVARRSSYVGQVHHTHGGILVVDHGVACVGACHQFAQFLERRLRAYPIDLRGAVPSRARHRAAGSRGMRSIISDSSTGRSPLSRESAMMRGRSTAEALTSMS